VIGFSIHHQEDVMKKKLLVGLAVFLAIWILGACSAESEMEPGDFKSYSRCDLFANEELSVVLYGIYPGDTTVKMYIKFESGEVIGLEDGRDDGLSWDYSVKIGEVESFGCGIFEGEIFAGRLYCVLPLPPEYRNAARPAAVHVNGCPEAILSIPQLSLLVEKTSAGSGGSGGTGGSSGSSSSGSSGGSGSSQVALPVNLNVLCGSNPGPSVTSCYPDYEAWCNCMGGLYSCNIGEECDLP
jgi:uncharacterized membrane protein YgcG